MQYLYQRFLIIPPNRKQPKCASPSEWMNSSSITIHRTPLNNRTKPTTNTCNSMHQSQTCYIKCKKPDSKDNMLI